MKIFTGVKSSGVIISRGSNFQDIKYVNGSNLQGVKLIRGLELSESKQCLVFQVWGQYFQEKSTPNILSTDTITIKFIISLKRYYRLFMKL